MFYLVFLNHLKLIIYLTNKLTIIVNNKLILVKIYISFFFYNRKRSIIEKEKNNTKKTGEKLSSRSIRKMYRIESKI